MSTSGPLPDWIVQRNETLPAPGLTAAFNASGVVGSSKSWLCGSRMLTIGGDCAGTDFTVTWRVVLPVRPSLSTAVSVSVRLPVLANATSFEQPVNGNPLSSAFELVHVRL